MSPKVYGSFIKNVTGGIVPTRRMDIKERFSYLSIQNDRYKECTTRKEKSALLKETAEVAELDRKTVIRHFSSGPRRKTRRKQRKPKYGAAVQNVVHLVAKALDYPCPERLKAGLLDTAESLMRHGHLVLEPEVRQKLIEISISTIGRIRRKRQQDEPRIGRERRPGKQNSVQKQVPIRRIPWDITEPGHFEVDLVHHSGPSATGEFVCTLQMVDVATGWTESAAILGRSYRVVRDAFRRCLSRLPFEPLEIHSDNGPEFLNHHLLRFWKTYYPDVDLSRIRPYKKQENRFVEHRNGALVRSLLGKDRLDTMEQTLLLNQLYDRVWLYFNFFQPVMRMTEKTYEGGKTKRKHDDVRTPFKRICGAGLIPTVREAELVALHDNTDPLALREEIHQLIHQLFRLPLATQGHTEDIFATLMFPDAA
jgi:IS30 family transposase